MIRFNSFSKHAQRSQSHTAIIDRVNLSSRKVDEDLDDLSSESESESEFDEQEESLGYDTPKSQANEGSPQRGEPRLATKKVYMSPTNANDPTARQSEYKTFGRQMGPKSKSLPVVTKKNGLDPLLAFKLNKKTEEGTLRKGDSMLMSKKRLAKVIHETNGHNVMW